MCCASAFFPVSSPELVFTEKRQNATDLARNFGDNPSKVQYGQSVQTRARSSETGENEPWLIDSAEENCPEEPILV
jgi:hypothetical protein